MKAYLAGPMSGLPQFNFPEFKRVTALLRSQGWEIVSPAELDEQESHDAAMASPTGDPVEAHRTWGDYLSRDVKIIADAGIEAIVFLPNWEKSKGARLEASVGLQIKSMRFFEMEMETDIPVESEAGAIALGVFLESIRLFHPEVVDGLELALEKYI